MTQRALSVARTDYVVEPAAVGSRQVSRGQRATHEKSTVVDQQRREPAHVISEGHVAFAAAGTQQPAVDVVDNDAASASPARRQPP